MLDGTQYSDLNGVANVNNGATFVADKSDAPTKLYGYVQPNLFTGICSSIPKSLTTFREFAPAAHFDKGFAFSLARALGEVGQAQQGGRQIY